MKVILTVTLIVGIVFLILLALSIRAAWKDSMTDLGYSEKEQGDWNTPVDY